MTLLCQNRRIELLGTLLQPAVTAAVAFAALLLGQDLQTSIVLAVLAALANMGGGYVTDVLGIKV